MKTHPCIRCGCKTSRLEIVGAVCLACSTQWLNYEKPKKNMNPTLMKILWFLAGLVIGACLDQAVCLYFITTHIK